jgi:hypothetical protein
MPGRGDTGLRHAGVEMTFVLRAPGGKCPAPTETLFAFGS